MRASPTIAGKYAILKKKLAQEHPNDIDRYCEAKTGFIVGVVGK
jgi:GrpB-like predicted nucleotidyltransferase (UPF0157 family)